MESMKRSMNLVLTPLPPCTWRCRRHGDGGGNPAAVGLLAHDRLKTAFSRAPRSVRRLVLRQRLVELFHDRVGVTAGLAHIVVPLLAQRLGRGLPLGELRVGD